MTVMSQLMAGKNKFKLQTISDNNQKKLRLYRFRLKDLSEEVGGFGPSIKVIFTPLTLT